MKTIFIISIIIFIVLIPIAVMIIIPIAIYGKTWWFLWWTLIIEGSLGIIIGIIFLIAKLLNKSKIPIEKDIKEIIAEAVNELKNDEHDPDNFIIDKKPIWKIGEKGSEKTPILVLKGLGTESNLTRVCIINLKNPKEKTWLKGDDATDEQVLENAIKLSESQPEEEKERITTGRDQFGLPMITREITKPSHSEIEKQKEIADAESKNII